MCERTRTVAAWLASDPGGPYYMNEQQAGDLAWTYQKLYESVRTYFKDPNVSSSNLTLCLAQVELLLHISDRSQGIESVPRHQPVLRELQRLARRRRSDLRELRIRLTPLVWDRVLNEYTIVMTTEVEDD